MADASVGTILADAAGHALLGCAAQSLLGGDCAGGAIGGAASAIAAPLIRDAIYDGSQTVVGERRWHPGYAVQRPRIQCHHRCACYPGRQRGEERAPGARTRRQPQALRK
ncbi:hypothetical protein ACU4GD_37935 [Cupriavidus basilensis]